MSSKMEYVRLGNSGLKVSRLIQGCMAFGSPAWEGSPWTLGVDEGLRLLKKAYDLGINTWDTAGTYSNGASEATVGKALRQFAIPRSRVVPAANDGALVNQMGLSRKHVFKAVDDSLARLGTDYIDVLQIHRLDRETPPEEIMEALHDVVRSGKVRYLGASSMYAWEFARLQHVADKNGWTKFVSMQPFYNLLYREEEREMLPFCAATGLARPNRKGDGGGGAAPTLREQTDVKSRRWNETANPAIVDRVEELAKKKGVSMAVLATATEERIEEAVQALSVKLTEEELRYLEEEYKPREVQGM
ncbi:aryl-alcohol dehydrogenase [Gaeumannomyces tritici R3-111a-1]|uniref:Aryl-alcohol dehydrogenase n=1 Tax=Gaeumannomyces tritici (strain R3-111a-1) TaxID=644352 RepID=J3P1A1_GAET3|nr:aryl-alcohol dehydrogenase [Gaeumannomyces tritici R3-111a-1]EJT77386.1 aryl-alcohol dehydrogenase [Gaeumannomyces tritici R3-111a-1]